jgi:hypothetical protein
MANEEETLFGPTLAELGRLRAELRAILATRFELARLESVVALADFKWLALALAISGLLALVSLPVLVVAAADALAGTFGIERVGWLLIWFAGLVVAAVLTAWLGWRRFERRFVGWEETLEVLREDQAWIESLVEPRKR